jgi:hypothetical protein
MAGTRLWIQCSVVSQLVTTVWIAFYIGFCPQHPRRQNHPGPVTATPKAGGGLSPPKGFPVLPQLYDDHDTDSFQFDPLCPIPYIVELWECIFGSTSSQQSKDNHNNNNNNNKKEDDEEEDGTHYSTTLQILVVFEDAYDIQYWSTILYNEWDGIPSYLYGLQPEQLQFGWSTVSSPSSSSSLSSVGGKQQQHQPKRQPSQRYKQLIELTVVPPMTTSNGEQQQLHLNDTTIQSIWNHLSSTVPSIHPLYRVNDKDSNDGDDSDNDGSSASFESSTSSLLVLYIPSNLPNNTIIDHTNNHNHSNGTTMVSDDDHHDDGPTTTKTTIVSPPLVSYRLRPKMKTMADDGTSNNNNPTTKTATTTTTWLVVPTRKDVGPARRPLGTILDEWMIETIGSTFGSNKDMEDGTHLSTSTSLLSSSSSSDDDDDEEWWQVIHDQWQEQTMRLWQRHHQQYHYESDTTLWLLSLHPILQRALQVSDRNDENRRDYDDNHNNNHNTNNNSKNNTKGTEDDGIVIAHLQTAIGEWHDAHSSLLRLLVAEIDDGPDHCHNRPEEGMTMMIVQSLALEQYAAIFLPLLFPLLFPFCISLVVEYKRFQTKNQEKGTPTTT